jgi:hypothetical protein
MLHGLPRLVFSLAVGISLAVTALSTASAVNSPKQYIVDTTAADPGGAMNGCDFPNSTVDCSLVGAINKANANPTGILGPDSITFAIGSGVQTITLGASLPAIADAVVIDGSTQTADATCGSGVPCIHLNASVAFLDAFTVSANDVTIRDLAVHGFHDGDAFHVTSGANVVIAGNYIGTADGLTAPAIKNFGGVVVEGGDSVTVGGTTASDRNIIGGNQAEGVVMAGGTATVEGNYIGLGKDGATAISNGGSGILVYSGTNTIGGTAPGAGNVISGQQGSAGIAMKASATIQGNFIGTNAAGTAAVPNDVGISVYQASGTIGGSTAGARNVISGNTQGININVSGIDVKGNYIGLNAAGTAAVGNTEYGIKVLDTSTTSIGGLGAGEGNVISGNLGAGVWLHGRPSPNAPGASIQGNYIGTNAAGTAAVPNTDGVYLANDGDATYPNNSDIAGNLISGNGAEGINIVEGDDNVITENLIGTDATGQLPIGNGEFGIRVVNGREKIIGNTVSGNAYGGVAFLGTPASGNSEVYQNYIGTNADLDSGLGNGQYGFSTDASNIRFGSETAPTSGQAAGGNVVWNNGAEGVLVLAGTEHVSVVGNSIDNNGAAGISVQNSVGMPVPVLTSAQSAGGITHITGSIANGTNAPYLVEFFASPACDPSGFGEGRTFLGSISVGSGAPGTSTIDATVPGSTAGQAITATATGDSYDTSSFSQCVTAEGPTPTPSPTASPTPTPSPTPSGSVTPTPTGAVLRGDANCDGHVTLDDLTAVLSELAGVDPGAPCADRADVNCSGSLDADDALRILAFVANAPISQPGGCAAIG